ncbi:hypothetical protein [Pseudorhodoferax sp.]|uniref:hypothetical protein n=1 Tax=Pseudorhodoferax sp. TaxID=1993553 RepID=UPI002DD6239F|nr:hypothetical protein [Pseudorhodoferax sp.]
MAEVRLLLEEKFEGADRLQLDLFDRPLTLNDAGELASTTTLGAAQFELTFDEGTRLPVPGGDDQRVEATARLLGTVFLAIPAIRVALQVRRETEQVATITDLLVVKMDIGEAGFDWGGLKVYQSQAQLVLGAQPCQLKLVPDDGKRVASFRLLQADFDFVGELAFSASGARGTCEASAETKDRLRQKLQELLTSSVTVTAIGQCRAVLDGESWSVALDVAFNIPYFSGGDGEMELTASCPAGTTGWSIESAIKLGNVTRWTDPWGWFQIENPSIDVRFTANADTFKPDVSLGGKFTFLPGSLDRLDKKVADWFGGLFDGMSTDFDCSFSGQLPTLALKPVSPFRLKALDMLQLRIPHIDLGFGGRSKSPSFQLKGIDLSLNIGDVGLRGTLPTITFDPFEGLDVAGGSDITVDIALSAPGGVKGSGKISYIDKELLRYLEGAGQLSTPTLPGVAVAFRVGQFRPSLTADWLPTVLLYADVPAGIPLFPMVTVQRIGLGMGVNCEVQGTSRLTLAQARRRVQEGLPDVSKLEAWTPTPHTALTLLARLFAGPTPQETVVGFYSADMTLIINSEAQAAVFGKLWLYTQTAHARTQEFQQRPAALALMLLDGQEPSLRIAAQTTGNGRTSVNADGLAGQLMGFGLPSMRLAFEATRNGLLLVLGPNEMVGQLGPLRVTATSLLAFRAATDGSASYVMSKSSLRAVFDWRASASIGPVRLAASFNAGFAADLQLLGSYASDRLLIYGNASLVMNAVLALHASVGFSIRINCLFKSFTISWHVDYDFRLEVHVDLSLQVALSSTGTALGLDGHARAGVSVLGISASLSVPLSLNTEVVTAARSEFQQIEQKLRTVLGS